MSHYLAPLADVQGKVLALFQGSELTCASGERLARKNPIYTNHRQNHDLAIKKEKNFKSILRDVDAVADPEPSDKAGGGGGVGGYPAPGKRGGGGLKKTSSALRAKSKGGGRVPRAPPLDPPQGCYTQVTSNRINLGFWETAHLPIP